MATVSDGADEVPDTAQMPGNGASTLELEDYVSQHFICPISHRIMDFPVISPNGHTYDRDSILEWLSHRAVDPLSFMPLAAASLYPNRALHNEIIEQLERLVQQAQSSSDRQFGEAAMAKLRCLQATKASGPATATEYTEAGLLDKFINQCACVATWCGILAWEQVLVLTTSFGALACLVVDGVNSLQLRGSNRPSTLLSDFIRLAVWPSVPLPRHWNNFGRLTVLALRGVLLAPVAPICLALTLGSVLSLTRFAERCRKTRTVEMERAAQRQWFVHMLHMCNAATGISSVGLFLCLYLDYRTWRVR